MKSRSYFYGVAATTLNIVVNGIIADDIYGSNAMFGRTIPKLVSDVGARPHSGKFCDKLDREHMTQVHEAHFARFLELRRRHDPEEKFANEFYA